MRWTAAAIVLGACLAGAALAQDVPADGRFMAQWEERPSARDFERNYPGPALFKESPGIAVLCCAPREDRRLDCRVGFEWPAGENFGQASLAIAAGFRMTPASYASYSADSSNWLQIPIVWRLSSTPEGFDEIRRRITEGTQGLCRPEQPANAPAS
jgi:hypothetical protein